MLAIATQTISLTEFLALPETKPASEYRNGQIFTKPRQKGKHSALQGELVTLINHLLRTARRARAFPELRCTFGDRTVFVYRPHQETEVYEQPDAVLPVPSFASDLCLTVNDLFALLYD